MNTEPNPYINQNALFEWIVNSTEEAIISKDLNGIILTWNKAAEKIFGYSQTEIINKSISVMIPEDLLLEEKVLIEKIKNDQLVEHYETRRVKKDGSLINVSLTLSPIKDQSGKIIGASKILKDITEKTKAAKAFKESEEKYRTLFQSNPLPMFVLELPSLKFLDINNTAIDHYGYSREEFLGMTAFDIRPEEDKEKLARVESPKPNHTLNLGIWRHIIKSGQIIYVETSTHDIIYNGLNARMVLCNDVTEKLIAENSIRELNQTVADSEKKFRSIIENNKDIIILMNEKYEVVYRSPSAIAITGYTIEDIEERIKKGEVINQVHPDDQASVLISIQQVNESANTPIPLSFRSRHKDGHYVWLEGTITNYLSNPALKSIVQNLQDVTEKKQAEMQLVMSHEQLKKLTEKIPIAILKMETNSDGKVKFLFVSKGIQNIYPNYDQEDILGNGDLITDHIIEDDKKMFYEGYYNSLHNLVDLNVEFRIKVEKVAKWVKLFYHPEIQEDGNVKWYGYLEDINLQKKFLLELEHQNNKLKEIAWTQSHLVRAPLSRIMGLVSVFQKGALSIEDQQKFLAHIKNSTEELDNVIREITSKTKLSEH